MSHEIHTPMNGILGMTELLMDTALTPEQHGYLEIVQISAEALVTVLNDILDFSKIEAGKLDFESIDFAFHDSLGSTMKTLALRAHQKGLELAYPIQPVEKQDHTVVVVGDGQAGDKTLLEDIVALFLADAPVSIDSLRTAIAMGNANQTRETAHSLKGAVAALGATTAYAIAAELEATAQAGALQGAEAVLHRFDDEIHVIAAFFTELDWANSL